MKQDSKFNTLVKALVEHCMDGNGHQCSPPDNKNIRTTHPININQFTYSNLQHEAYFLKCTYQPLREEGLSARRLVNQVKGSVFLFLPG